MCDVILLDRECIRALSEQGRTIWVASPPTSPSSISLEECTLAVPQKLAIVIGPEGHGCSQEFVDVAEQFVHLPVFGFTESLTTSIFSALILYAFAVC